MEQIKPVVGMGITYQVGSDRYAGTITRVTPSGKTFWFTDDRSIPTQNTNMLSESQNFVYIPDVKQEEKRATWRRGKRPGFQVSGYSFAYVYLGRREAYRDPSF